MAVSRTDLSIVCPEDNGNIIDLNDDPNHIDPNNIRLAIRSDRNNSEWMQWFNFYMDFKYTPGVEYILNIENARDVNYPKWNLHKRYQTYASLGHDAWFHVPTVYDEATGKLTMTFIPEEEVWPTVYDAATETSVSKFIPEERVQRVQFAFFPPYTYARHTQLIERAKSMPRCHVTCLGKTNGETGCEITLVTFGQPAPHKKEIWIIARQHPGEPQAEWYAEGLIERLAVHKALFENYTFRIVPNMNPDGTYDGNLRTNRKGQDLNRKWASATMEDSPEVFFVREKMREIGVDFFLDVHSDETLPAPFVDPGHLGCPTIDTHMEELEKRFMDLYIMISNEMQNEYKYPDNDRFDSVNPTIAAHHIAEYFHCPSFTLEMPTKLWSLRKSKELGQDLVGVLHAFLPKPRPLDSTAQAKTITLRAPRENSIFEEQQQKSSVIERVFKATEEESTNRCAT